MKEREIVTDKLYKQTKSAEYAEGGAFPLMAALEYLDIPSVIGEYDSYIFPKED